MNIRHKQNSCWFLNILSSREGSRGSVVLEFTVVAPFIVFLILATVDVGNALDRYLTLTRISYEGARFGAAIAALEAGTFGKVELNDPTVASTNQSKIHTRVNDLLELNNFDFLTANVETTRISREITVSISIPHHSFINAIGKLDLSVSSNAPYLVQ